MKRYLVAIMMLVGTVASGAARAENWPQWRGPYQNGSTNETGLPVKWSADENVTWKLPLPGHSAATPAVWGEHIFVSTGDGKLVKLLSIDRAGHVRWERTIASGDRRVGGNRRNTLTTPSPITDGRHVWIFYGSGDLACFDFAGEPIWKRNLQKEYGKYYNWFGVGDTPILHEGKLFLARFHGARGEAKSYILGLDAATGKTLWKHDRVTDAEFESRDGYASPAVVDYGTRAEVVYVGADLVTGHDVNTGREIWRSGDVNLTGDRTLRIIVSPVVAGGMVYVSSAKQSGFFALRTGGKGDVTKSHKAWSFRRTSDVSTPAVANNLLFMLRGNGQVVCFDAATGNVLWNQRAGRGNYFASPVVGDGKVYILSEQGDCTVFAAETALRVLSTNKMNEPFLASPAISEGQIFLRSSEHHFCIGKRKTVSAADANTGSPGNASAD